MKTMAARGGETSPPAPWLASVPLGSPVFVDTNVLIYASFPELSLSNVARQCLNSIRGRDLPVWSSRQVLREFLATATLPGTLATTATIQAILGALALWADQLIIAEEDAE